MIAHDSTWAGPDFSNIDISQCPVDYPLTDDAIRPNQVTAHSEATKAVESFEMGKLNAFPPNHQTVAGVGLFPQTARLFEGRPSLTDIGSQTR